MPDNPYTARITSGPNGFDYVEFVIGPDETVENVLRVAHYDGRVIWAEKWGEIDKLASAGILRHVNYGPSTYGHVEYFYV